MSQSLLFAAVESGQLDTVAKLLDTSSDAALIHSATTAGETPLHRATLAGRVQMIQLLLAYGADVNAMTHTKYGGVTPLHLAARMNAVSIGEELLRHTNVNVNIRSTATGATPLIECAKAGATEFATWLLTLDTCDAYAIDSAGFSAHYYAKKLKHQALVNLLPTDKYQLWAQLRSEPAYGRQMSAVKESIEKVQRVAAAKALLAEKKRGNKKVG